MYEEHPVRIEFSATKWERLMTLHPATGEISPEDTGSTYSPRPTTWPDPNA